MIVERLELSGWRSYREPFAVEFDEGVNLIVGVNEAGKSTLFEAMTRALFDRHSSKAAEIRRIQPLDSSLAPEVTLVLRLGDERYRLRKRFLVEPEARLEVSRDGDWRLDHEGDRADEEVRRLLGGDAPYGVSKPKNRGLAQALWYLQKDPGLPPRDWGAALRDGLSGLVEAVLRTPETERFIALLDEEYARDFTATGRQRQKGELALSEREVASLRADLESRAGELSRAEAFREELVHLDERRQAAKRRQAEIQLRLAELRESLAQRAALDEELAALRKAMADAEKNEKVLAERVARLTLRQKRVAEIGRELQQVTRREEELRSKVREHRRSAEAHARKWEDDLTPRLKVVREKVEELKRHRRIAELEDEAIQLRARVERIEQLTAGVAAARATLTRSKAPSAEAMIRFRASLREAELLRTAMDVGAVRVRFDGRGEVSAEPEAPEKAGEFLVTEPTTFDLSDYGQVHIRRVDAPWREDAERYRALEEQIARQLEAAGVTHALELEELVAERQRQEFELENLEARLREQQLAAEGFLAPNRWRSRLAKLESEVSALRSVAPQAVLPGIETWVADQTQGELNALESDLEKLERRIAAERQSEQESQQKCFRANETLLEIGQRRSALSEERRSSQDRIAEELADVGSASALERLARRAHSELSEHKKAVELFLHRYSEVVEGPQAEVSALEKESATLVGQLEEVERRMTDRRARIEEVAALGLDVQVADLDARLTEAKERLEQVKRRARATKWLRARVQDREAERSLGLTAPVAQVLDPWLEKLTGERYSGVALDETLVPRDVRLSGHSESLPLESLSHGTHEQVTVLLRLALGVLLSENERQLVILDDRLVNADEERMARFYEILAEAGGSCQVLVATCRESAYSDLVGARVHLASSAVSPSESG
ncbi:MAG: AAA family ATPase [Acidobacteriota bacterium]